MDSDSEYENSFQPRQLSPPGAGGFDGRVDVCDGAMLKCISLWQSITVAGCELQ